MFRPRVLVAVSMVRLNSVTSAGLHVRPAEERDKQHHGPRGDRVEAPQDVSNGDRKVVISDDAVEGVEEVGLDVAEGLVHGLSLEVQDCLRRDRRQVHGLPVHLNRRRLGRNLEDIEGTRAGRPAVAKNRLRVAIEAREVRAVGDRRKLDGRLVESLVERFAAAYPEASVSVCSQRKQGQIGAYLTHACLVLTRHQHQPLLRTCSNGGVERVHVVVQCEVDDRLGGNLDLGLDGGRDGLSDLLTHAGERAAKVADEVLELGLVLLKRALSSGRKKRQREHGGCRETHCVCG